MAVTMKDIAQALGVSVVTVSKVMRDHADIGAETRQARAGQGEGTELPAKSDGAQPGDRTKLSGRRHRAHSSSSVFCRGSGGALFHDEAGRLCRHDLFLDGGPCDRRSGDRAAAWPSHGRIDRRLLQHISGEVPAAEGAGNSVRPDRSLLPGLSRRILSESTIVPSAESPPNI